MRGKPGSPHCGLASNNDHIKAVDFIRNPMRAVSSAAKK